MLPSPKNPESKPPKLLSCPICKESFFDYPIADAILLCAKCRPKHNIGTGGVGGCVSHQMPETLHVPLEKATYSYDYKEAVADAAVINVEIVEDRIGEPISIDELIAMRSKLWKEADAILIAKGNDYNSQQQKDGDTLFNLRICAILGIVESPIDGILVRMSDKLARLISLTRPGTEQQVKDESIKDTVVDLCNYATYLLAMRVKERESKGMDKI